MLREMKIVYEKGIIVHVTKQASVCFVFQSYT